MLWSLFLLPLAPKTRAAQKREGHWAIIDLIGKGGHIRTVPVPDWVKTAFDGWADAATISIATDDVSHRH